MDSLDGDQSSVVQSFSYEAQRYGFMMNPFYEGLENPLPPDTTREQLIEAKQSGRLEWLDRRMRQYVRSRVDHDYCDNCTADHVNDNLLFCQDSHRAASPSQLPSLQVVTSASASSSITPFDTALSSTSSAHRFDMHICMGDESTCTASEDENSNDDPDLDRYTFRKIFAKPDSTVHSPEDSSDDTTDRSNCQNKPSYYVSDSDMDSTTDGTSSDNDDASIQPRPTKRRKNVKAGRPSQNTPKSVTSSADSSGHSKAIRVFNAISMNTNLLCTQSDSEHQPDLRSLARCSRRKTHLPSFEGYSRITALGAIRATTAVISTSMWYSLNFSHGRDSWWGTLQRHTATSFNDVFKFIRFLIIWFHTFLLRFASCAIVIKRF